jgi:hypothetical protein
MTVRQAAVYAYAALAAACLSLFLLAVFSPLAAKYVAMLLAEWVLYFIFLIAGIMCIGGMAIVFAFWLSGRDEKEFADKWYDDRDV